MRFNESQLPKNDQSKDRQTNKKPAPGRYTSKDLEKTANTPFLGGR